MKIQFDRPKVFYAYEKQVVLQDFEYYRRSDANSHFAALESQLTAVRKRVDEAVEWLRKCKNYKLDPDVEMNIEDALTELTATKEGRP